MKTKPENLRHIGLFANSEKVNSVGIVKQAAKLIVQAGRKVFADRVTAEWTGIPAIVCPDIVTLTREVDLLLVFGGDGTMLRVARDIAGLRTPILGVNIGSLGFLTAVSSDELKPALKRLWKGEFRFEKRTLIQALGRCGSRLIQQTALNDLVISRGIASRLIELEVRINSDPLTRYRCDGLIVSSPTGSTAYSLAAGGAVVFPTAAVLELTPICPHTLSNRSLIVPLNAKIQVRVVNPKPTTILSADGQVVSELSSGDTLTIERSRRSVRLMLPADSSFCDTLRRKLHWRGATV